jgi:hypothetical protein
MAGRKTDRLYLPECQVKPQSTFVRSVEERKLGGDCERRLEKLYIGSVDSGFLEVLDRVRVITVINLYMLDFFGFVDRMYYVHLRDYMTMNKPQSKNCY